MKMLKQTLTIILSLTIFIACDKDMSEKRPLAEVLIEGRKWVVYEVPFTQKSTGLTMYGYRREFEDDTCTLYRYEEYLADSTYIQYYPCREETILEGKWYVTTKNDKPYLNIALPLYIEDTVYQIQTNSQQVISYTSNEYVFDAGYLNNNEDWPGRRIYRIYDK